MVQTKKKRAKEEGFVSVGGLLGGLNKLLENLSELAEKGEELRKTGEILGPEGKVKGVYGFNIKVGIGEEKGVRVEPFGNVHTDELSGKVTVDEVREPMVDLFDEEEYVLIVAEMPGVSDEDIKLEVKDDILTIAAQRGEKKYRKEVLLPKTFAAEKMTHTCRNGVLEVRFAK